MAEPLLLALVGTAVVLAIAWPLLGDARPSTSGGSNVAADPEAEALEVRHRLALEALRDVEADHRAGSLDDAAYRSQRDEAEARAAQTLRALDAARLAAPAEWPAGAEPAAAEPKPSDRTGRRVAALIGGALVLLLLAGYAAPPPLRIAERDARTERIRVLTEALQSNPRDAAALIELSDLYLQGGTADDVTRALVSLVLLRDAAPEARDSHERLVTLLIRAGLWQDAAAATDDMARVVGEDDVEVVFFRGLIARGRGDHDEAVRQFDRFLRLAPDDPRTTMVRGLRAQEMAAD